MKVSLKRKPLKDGKQQSLYLDIYPPPAACSRYEFLKLYIPSIPVLLHWLWAWADDAGVSSEGLAFHSMRHTLAALML